MTLSKRLIASAQQAKDRRLATWGAGLFCATVTLALVQSARAQSNDGGMSAIDTNRDGAITRAEAEAARADLFSRLDRDADNHLDEAERSLGEGARVSADADADGDNRLSRNEFMGQPYRVFDRLDLDSDGVLSAAEIEAARPR
jgi:hypothetical protein